MMSDRPPSIAVLRAGFGSAHVGLAASDKGRRANARGAARPIAVGTLMALPILTTPDGRPFDLLEATEGSAVILLFVPADATILVRTYATAAASFVNQLAAAAGRLFIIAPRAEAEASRAALLIDQDGGFAYSLGLADWDDECGCADLDRPVGLVLDRVGNVVAADLGGMPDIGRLLASLPSGSAMGSSRTRRG